jgi:hypothetical protein
MTAYTPSVSLTIFPRVNFYKTFGTRFDARAANGRIFGPNYQALSVLQAGSLANNNSYEVGNTIQGTTAIFQGGNPDNTTYRYRWQRRVNSSASWASDPWTNYDNTATPVSLPLTQGGQIRLNSQGRDNTDPDNIVQINTFTSVKDVTTTIGTLLINPDSVGSCSVDDEITFSMLVTGGTSTGYTYEWSIRAPGVAVLLSPTNMGQTAAYRFTTAGVINVQCYVGDSFATNNPQLAVKSIIVN